MEKKDSWVKRAAKAWGETYWKRIMTVIVYNAIGWVWCSYVLAWFGRPEIADELSKTALSAILGVVVAYAVKSTSENISKNGFVGKRSAVNYDVKPDTWTDMPEYDSAYTSYTKTETFTTSCIDYPEDKEPNGGGKR